MKSPITLTLAALAVCFLQSPAIAETLNAEQVRSLMINKHVTWSTPDGEWTGSSRYKSNGKSSISVTKPEKFSDRGTWKINGNVFCSKWKKLRDGKERCSTIRTTKTKGLYRMDSVFLRSK